MMDIEALNSIAARDVRIMDAVYRTRAALVHRNGMRVQCEGRQQALDFHEEIDLLTEVLELIGIDPSRAPTPTRRDLSGGGRMN